MKTYDELTPEELTDLVSIELRAGRIYYSMISFIGDNWCQYDGNKVDVSNPETIQLLLEGKQKYELYKLSISESNLKNLIKDESKDIIESVFEKEMRLSFNQYEVRSERIIDDMREKIEKSDILLGQTTEMVKNTKEIQRDTLTAKMKLETIIRQMTAFDESYDFDNFKKKFDLALESVEDSKNVFDGLVQKMKSLFN